MSIKEFFQPQWLLFSGFPILKGWTCLSLDRDLLEETGEPSTTAPLSYGFLGFDPIFAATSPSSIEVAP